jgi:hypothetical protein
VSLAAGRKCLWLVRIQWYRQAFLCNILSHRKSVCLDWCSTVLLLVGSPVREWELFGQDSSVALIRYWYYANKVQKLVGFDSIFSSKNSIKSQHRTQRRQGHNIHILYLKWLLDYITTLFNILKPSGLLRTTRFNVQKFYKVLALRWVFCRALSTESGLCFVRH